MHIYMSRHAQIFTRRCDDFEDLRAVGDRRAHRLGDGGDGPRQEREYSVSTPGGYSTGESHLRELPVGLAVSAFR